MDPILPTSAGLHVDRQSIDVLLATGYTGFVWIGLGLFGGRKGRFFVLMAALFHALAMGARVFWDPKFEMGAFEIRSTPSFIWPFPFSRNTAC